MHALLLITLLAPAPVEKEAPKGLEKFQGVWKVTSTESRGVAQPANNLRTADRYTLAVVGDVYVLNQHAGTLSVDLDKKTVDMKVTEGRYRGQTIHGIFELKGDTLQLAFLPPTRAGERPKELKTGADTLHVLYTYERNKATKEQAEAKLKELKAAVAAGPAPAAGFRRGTTAADRTTQQLLQEILGKLERIEKRLDEIEKKGKDK